MTNQLRIDPTLPDTEDEELTPFRHWIASDYADEDDDPHRAPRGIVTGLLISLPLWVVGAALVWAIWVATP
ncbi:MAG TPA: hypothetical protein VGQ34_11560 [Sphingomicrobium sp.]|jgi:hypothetical protein|nr:hypothetical protein [Sphingomicrobium sp.]